MKGNRLIHYILSLLFIIPVTWFGIHNYRKKQRDIDANKGIATGTIISHQRAGRSGTATAYEYYVAGTRYEAYSGDDKRFDDLGPGQSPVGLRFRVEYSTTNPANSRILWSQPMVTDSSNSRAPE